jgi:hypothetical protein
MAVLLYWMSFVLSVVNADCHKQTHYGECCYAECRYAECRSALKRYCNLLGHFEKKCLF